jgi:hypothetical protein
MIWASSDSPFTAIGVAEDEIGCLVLIETRKMTSSELQQRLLGRESVLSLCFLRPGGLMLFEAVVWILCSSMRNTSQ